MNCGSVGLPNLELRHRGKKVCQANKAKRDKEAKTKKNKSILSFFTQPKAKPVPSTITSQTLIHGRNTTLTTYADDSAGHEAEHESIPGAPAEPCEPVKRLDFLSKLLDAIERLPASVPEASEYDKLAVFAGNPGDHDDPNLDATDLWEEKLNGLLKSVFGWGAEGDMSEFIQRGRNGLDGLTNFIKYFVVKRGVSLALFEGKLAYLLERIEEKSVFHLLFKKEYALT